MSASPPPQSRPHRDSRTAMPDTSAAGGPSAGRGTSVEVSRRCRFHPEQIDHPSLGFPMAPKDYEKIGMLGKGDVGRVYLVREKFSGNLYAMKVFNKLEIIKRQKVIRVMTERHALGAINHPFFVTLYHAFQSFDKLFLIESYCAGGEFMRVLHMQPERRLTENVARFYGAEILLGLEYMHLIGFVYRDLKPENLLVSSSGHIKISDFDLSKEVHEKQAFEPVLYHNPGKKFNNPIVSVHPTLYKTNSFVGTVEYIAPEIIRGAGHDGTLDWWTFGIFLHEILFGTTPFKGSSNEETFSKIISNKLSFPSSVQVSNEARDLISKLLKKESSRRLGSRYGAADIKAHPFFRTINWPLIRNQKPPIDVVIRNPLDTSRSRKLKDDLPFDLDQELPMDDHVDPTGLFYNFTYHRQPLPNTYCDVAPLKVI